MNRLHHTQRRSLWSHLCILLAVLATLASVRPAHAAMSVWLVKDINPAGASSFTSYPEFTVVGSTLFFVANDGVHGWELWTSDGSESGTLMVKDINPTDRAESIAYDLTVVGGILFFFTDDGVHGTELWKSDGSESGTLMVKDINPTGGSGSNPGGLTVVGDTLFFRADDGVHGLELWTSDGTEAGTTMLKDINPATTTYYFPIIRTAAGTTEAGGMCGCPPPPPPPPPSIGSDPIFLTALGGTLFFFADDGVHGRELWTSDGTESGTTMLKDIYPPATPSFTVVGNTLFFSPAEDGVHGPELWRSDGTEAGTILVKDIRPGSTEDWGYPWWLMNVQGTLFFNAEDGVHGNELWRSDGTAAGTTLVKDITSGNLPYIYPANLTAMGNTLFFHADDGVHGRELWRSDGTEAGTTMLKDINLGGGSGLSLGDLPELTVVDHTLFFAADDGAHGVEPWTSDGTAAGTILVQDINSGSGGSDPYAFTRIGTTLFFSAATSETGHELWAMELPLTYH